MGRRKFCLGRSKKNAERKKQQMKHRGPGRPKKLLSSEQLQHQTELVGVNQEIIFYRSWNIIMITISSKLLSSHLRALLLKVKLLKA